MKPFQSDVRFYSFQSALWVLLFLGLSMSCQRADHRQDYLHVRQGVDLRERMQQYVRVPLTSTVVPTLSDSQKQVLRILLQAATLMDTIFWHQAFGDPDSLYDRIHPDSTDFREYIAINYGPWDRLQNDSPFVEGFGPKPLGANFYPADMRVEEFEKSSAKDKASLYTMIRRDKEGNLVAIPYHEYFKEATEKTAALLRQAAAWASSPSLRRYLELRSHALLTDDYRESDRAWLDMKDNIIDVIIGPIETYEDRLFGYKAAHECYILLKDTVWSSRLKRFAQYLPELQRNLPVPPAYKRETPGRDVELNAYDVIYYAGHCNAGPKTIAINLPNDETVQLEKGTRRLQLKNVMKYKFDSILVPIARQLLDTSLLRWLDFDAFFANTMFHEVAHGLGIKYTLDGKNTVREALRQHASAIEEGKADILGIYMIKQLHDKGDLSLDLRSYYTTFIASIFRSIRFGATSAHGIANTVRFNFFVEKGVIQFDRACNCYRIDFTTFEDAVRELSQRILLIQGDGNAEAAGQLIQQYGKIPPQLHTQLQQLSERGIPVDLIFDQGADILGL